MSNEAKEQPVAKIKVGSVQMAIWRNQGEHGSFYNASVQLSYKDRDGKWMNNGSSYGLRDVLNLAKAAMLAHSEIGKLIAADKKAAGEKPGDDEDAE